MFFKGKALPIWIEASKFEIILSPKAKPFGCKNKIEVQ